MGTELWFNHCSCLQLFILLPRQFRQILVSDFVELHRASKWARIYISTAAHRSQTLIVVIRLLILNDSTWHACPVVRQLGLRQLPASRCAVTPWHHSTVSDQHCSVRLWHKGVLCFLILLFIFSFDLNRNVLGQLFLAIYFQSMLWTIRLDGPLNREILEFIARADQS